MKIYEGKTQITKECRNDVLRELVDRKHVMNFIQTIPLEKLKLIFNFHEIDYEDNDLWIKAEESNDEYMLRKLNELAEKRHVELICKIKI